LLKIVARHFLVAATAMLGPAAANPSSQQHLPIVGKRRYATATIFR